MSVLVAVASKHGSTREIGESIGDELRAQGLPTDVRDVGEVTDLTSYSAAILGSAVYMGRLMAEARRFAETNQDILHKMPVWVFSSGPIGDPPQPAGNPPELDRLATELGAVASRSFAGEIDPAGLGLKERLVVKAVRAQPGDFRDWDEIRAWADEIAAALRSQPVS